MQSIIGLKFGRLTVVSEEGVRNKIRRFSCVCSCGNVRSVAGTDLRRGHSKSCGCLQKQLASKANRTHRKTNSTEYHSWSNMKARCLNKNHPRWADYGGRGIFVCQSWIDSFECFLKDMGKCPAGYSIDRIDVNGNYEPSNCRWASNNQQARNCRKTKIVEYMGRALSLPDHCEMLGLDLKCVKARVALGWTLAEAFEIPVNKSNKIKTLRKLTSDES
jgi:hypothetical protein